MKRGHRVAGMSVLEIESNDRYRKYKDNPHGMLNPFTVMAVTTCQSLLVEIFFQF
jgi:hypothetical protein